MFFVFQDSYVIYIWILWLFCIPVWICPFRIFISGFVTLGVVIVIIMWCILGRKVWLSPSLTMGKVLLLAGLPWSWTHGYCSSFQNPSTLASAFINKVSHPVVLPSLTSFSLLHTNGSGFPGFSSWSQHFSDLENTSELMMSVHSECSCTISAYSLIYIYIYIKRQILWR